MYPIIIANLSLRINHLRLRELEITGFRNLARLKLDFEPRATLFAFVGKNGQGKTNLLEAIFLCGLSKSFRTAKNQDLIGFEEDFCRVGVTLSEAEVKTLEVIITRVPADKVFKVNGVKHAATEFVGHLPLVFFSPDDLSELGLSPTLRRRYLNVMLGQLDRRYLETLLKYTHALHQRNVLLRQIRDKKAKERDLDVWDEALAPLGMKLVTERAVAVEALYPLVARFYKKLSGVSGDLAMGYQVSAEPERLAEKLAAARPRDVATGATSVGPHRDDLRFLWNGHDMQSFASRGEWRSLVLALKLAEKEWMREKCGTDPILLLDDVFSELDDERQKTLIENLGHSQVFLTTTHVEFLKDIQMPQVVHEIRGGEVL